MQLLFQHDVHLLESGSRRHILVLVSDAIVAGEAPYSRDKSCKIVLEGKACSAQGCFQYHIDVICDQRLEVPYVTTGTRKELFHSQGALLHSFVDTLVYVSLISLVIYKRCGTGKTGMSTSSLLHRYSIDLNFIM